MKQSSDANSAGLIVQLTRENCKHDRIVLLPIARNYALSSINEMTVEKIPDALSNHPAYAILSTASHPSQYPDFFSAVY
ncbi:MAG: hypothetical protein ACREAB_08570 [Blastocatellia bacterium]